jgi:predicted permease
MTRDRARRCFRASLWLVPRPLRDRHGEDMEVDFLDRFDRASAVSSSSALAVVVGAVFDAALAVPRHWLAWRSFRALQRAPRGPREVAMLSVDVRAALRSFRRQGGSTALVVLMLALGIAANVVVFSLVDALLLRPLAFPDADRLVYINEAAPRWNLDVVGVNYADFWQWHEHATAFADIALYDDQSFNLSDDQSAERVSGGTVTRGFFDVLGVKPILGRTFSADEDRPKGPAVAILSERLWRERFGADAHVVGRMIRTDGSDRTIVGVFPRQAEFPDDVAMWVPFQGDLRQAGNSYGGNGIGRMRPGITVAQADASLRLAHEPIWRERDRERVVTPFARSLRNELVADASGTIPALLGAVGLLLVVACANVAAVMLARAIARRREIGIRMAVGASRGRLVRQLFAENLLLAAVGGAAGVAAGRWALAAVRWALEDRLPHWAAFGLDVRVALFAVGVTLAAAMLFGWMPALHALRGDIRAAVHDSVGATTAAPSGRRTLTTLVGAEFALATLLVGGSGLLFRAFQEVGHVDPGFRADHVLTFHVTLAGQAYDADDRRLGFWNDLLTRIEAAPGVESAGVVSCPPLDCHWGYFFEIEGAAPVKPGDARPVVLTRVASEGYKDAMGLRLDAGRFLEARDREPKADPSIVVNEAFAHAFYSRGTQVVGKRIKFHGDNAPWTWMTIVGVTHDVKHYGLERPMRPGVYLPLAWPRTRELAVVVRTTGDPAAFTATARSLVAAQDPHLPLYKVSTMEGAVAESLRLRTVYSWLLAIFAALALTLAVGGTYGVTSYLANQRAREIGIRLAIGARPSDIVRAVLRTSRLPILTGTAIGVAVTILLAGRLDNLLFSVSPHDPTVLGASSAILVAAALAANWLPARRASRADPVQSLRV